MSSEKEMIKQAVSLLASGGLVVFPTETFYGIAADVDNPQALDRLAQLKGRRKDKPFGLIAASQAQAALLIAQATPLAQSLMAQHWPGALTMIFEAQKSLHGSLLSSSGGVGIRVSSHPTAAALAEGLGRAITATSANLGDGAPAASVAELNPALAEQVDLVLDLGPCPGGPASTVLDVRHDPPLLIRPGAIEIPDAVPVGE